MSLRMIASLILLAWLVISQYRCGKISLEESYGYISHASLEWFETEQLAYVFFELYELQNRLIDPVWELAWVAEQVSGGLAHQDYQVINFADGVHQHSLVPCGAQRICGSFSFRADKKFQSAQIRFRYDRASSMAVEYPITVINHEIGNHSLEQSNLYSTLVFGTFDAENEHVLVHFQGNFASLSASELKKYGMTRRYSVRAATLSDRISEEIELQKEKTGSSTLFPASFCEDILFPQNPSTALADSAGESFWLQERFSSEDPASGVCFSTMFHDKEGRELLNRELMAYARRNPRLSRGNLVLKTPLQDVIPIPVILQICEDEPLAANMLSPQFLRYQKHILGLSDQNSDLCFRIGREREFEQGLRALLSSKLQEARAAGDGRDFIYLVLFHENFTSEFQSFHNIISKLLAERVEQDRVTSNVSPRLVGSFIYASSTLYQPALDMQQHMIWCPQELLSEFDDDIFGEQNCTIADAFSLDLRIINFVAPLGPFPSRASYESYVARYQDEGLAKQPSLTFYSVPTDISTRIEASEQVTFFANQRYPIAVGESARICSYDGAMNSIRFRSNDMSPAEPSYDASTVNSIWLSDDAAGEYLLGISWEYPFFGIVRYESAIHGKISSVIPFKRSVRAYEVLGDLKWQAEQWEIGKLIQHCRQYCDHPFFDDGGTYQINSSWRKLGELQCPKPRIPAYQGAGL